jgi:hypothetical protein
MADEATEALNAAIATALAAAVGAPKRVRGDAGEVEQHSLADLLALRREFAAAATTATTTGRRGLRFNKLIPDGTT